MIDYLFPPLEFLGLESASPDIKVAKVVLKKNGILSLELFLMSENTLNVKQLDTHHPVIVTAIEEKELLLRHLSLPVTKKNDIEAALPFQVEPLLPYPPESAVFAYQVALQTADRSDLLLFSIKKEALEGHIHFWQAQNIEPERIGTVPSALLAFGKMYLPSRGNYLIIHMQKIAMTAILIKDGKLAMAYTSPEGIHRLGNDEKEASLKKIKQEMAKMIFALLKECKETPLEGVLMTGCLEESLQLESFLNETFSLQPLGIEATTDLSHADLLSFAVPIGLSLEAFESYKEGINFRQNEFAYPSLWKRFLVPLASYLIAILLACLSFYFLTEQYVRHEESFLKQNYVDLLSRVSRPYDDFEKHFASKNNAAPHSLEDLTREEMEKRLLFLQKELQSSPDSFPLFANVPRVSDLLAWLSHHAATVSSSDEGKSSALQVESLSYALVKRPQMGKKQEKYQVKVDLEFSTEKPKSAREFHDALITPNDWVDPKGEIKWNSNRGKYKTSFYLKDKTVYPSSS